MLTQPTIGFLSKLVLLAKLNTEMSRQFCVLLILEYKQYVYVISQRVLSEYVKILFKCACQIGYKLNK